jgi:phosphate transport system permease protein
MTLPGVSAVHKRARSGDRKTRTSVKAVDALARVLITLGGIGTIVAVSLVCVFLVWVVVPLFLAPSLPLAASYDAPPAASDEAPLSLRIDEYVTMSWSYHRDGTLRKRRLDDGTLMAIERPFPDVPTAWSIALRDGHVGFAFRDGTIRLGKVDFGTRFLSRGQVPPELHDLPVGGRAVLEGGVVERTSEQQYREQRLSVRLEQPLPAQADSPILLFDQSVREAGPAVVTLSADGILRIHQVTRVRNILTGEETTRLAGGSIPIDMPPGGAWPRWLLLSGLGDATYVVWEDGMTLRYDTRQRARPVLAETLDLVPERGERLTAVDFLIGKTSLVTGDTLGRVRTWFRVKPDGATTPDGSVLVTAHDLSATGPPVTTLAASSRTRMLAAGFAGGGVELYHVTSNRVLAGGRIENGPAAVAALALAPRDDALFATSGSRFALWRVEAPHPESSWASIFQPVWYEGFLEPAHVWQSSSGTDDFEPKYGLYPLVFGTVKATFYSMLFGLPLAILAAIYTSEFMHPRAKAVVKPTVEMMASLPSVVLGFLAALVIAPYVEDVVPEILLAIFAVPFTFLLGAHLWQLLPTRTATRYQEARLWLIVLAFPAGVWLAFQLGRPVERWLYAGDIRAWLDGQAGSGVGGWMILLLPLSAALVAFGVSRWVSPRFRRRGAGAPSSTVALLDLGKLLLATAATLAVTLLLSRILTGMGWDPRGSFVGTYVQRNALVVGFIMGFAIIPIIYTISEDALSAVPEHLRAASLGAGATPWQTAFRIIVPTAMSGLFSAAMVGLGRAVGETMIVLMAAGNTPLMDWNIFNGFRTLSANIAVELPEAVRNSTHYRMLFLAALSLFAMTFIVNTVAEVVRLRFRRRAYQL